MRNRSGLVIPPGLRDMMLASLLFAVMVAMVKEVSRELPVAYAVFSRSAVSLVLSWWLLRRAALSWRGDRIWLLFVRGLVGFAALMCVFESVSRIPLSDAAILFHTQPIWTAILARLFLREPTRPRTWLATAVSLAGVLVVVRPAFIFGAEAARALDPLGVALALIGSVLAGGAYVAVRALRRSDDTITIVFWFALVATPAAVPALVTDLRLPTAYQLMLLLEIGVAVQGAQLLLTRALRTEPAGRVAAVGYLQVVFATAIGVVVFGEALTPLVVVGALLVIAGALLATLEPAPSVLTPRPGSDSSLGRPSRDQPAGD